MSKTLVIEERAKVLQVSLHRPEVRNAMNEVMIAELLDCFRNISASVRAVVLKGSGDFFCAGGDLHWMKSSLTKSKSENESDALQLAKMIRAVDECPVPVITQVRGGAYGGGVGLVAASDIVVSDEKSSFSLSEVKLGLIPATIGPLVMRKIGYSEARRFYLSGRRFSAAEAKAIGLIHEYVPAASLLSVTQDYVREFESAGPLAVRRAKALIRETLGPQMWSADISERTSQVLSEVRVGAEAQEGISAFLEKRKAKWIEALS